MTKGIGEWGDDLRIAENAVPTANIYFQMLAFVSNRDVLPRAVPMVTNGWFACIGIEPMIFNKMPCRNEVNEANPPKNQEELQKMYPDRTVRRGVL